MKFRVLGGNRRGDEKGGGEREEDGEGGTGRDERHDADATEAQPAAPVHSRIEVER